MKRIIRFIFIPGVALLVLLAGLVWAKDTKSVAVLPFVINSGENIDYVRDGIWDMLSSRISSNAKIDVTAKDKVLESLKEKGARAMTTADIYALGKKMNVNYVVWGSVSKIGNNLSIDGKLLDITTYQQAVGVSALSHGMDEVIPKINDFAQRISDHVMGISSATAAPVSPASTAKAAPQAASASAAPARESEIIAGMRKSSRGTFTSAINPDFINAFQPVDKKGFWMSENFPTEFRGMDIGDVNGDGLNEIVTIDRNTIRIFIKKGKNFQMLQKISGKSFDSYYSVDVADINKNGVPEIIVTNIITGNVTDSAGGNRVSSFILEWKNGKFVEIASKLPWLLRVVSTPAGPKLVGQTLGMDRPFGTPIYEIVWEDGKYREGKRMNVPLGLAVFNFTIDVVEVGGSEKIIALNNFDYLCIYDPTEKSLEKLQVYGGTKELLYKGDEAFGGSNLYIDYYGHEYTGSETEIFRAYLNARILTHDTNKDGKKEIMIVRNGSASGRILKNVRIFTSSEIYNLEWDGLGLVENWRTRKINGYVADYQFKDVDNDGEKEVVMALVLSAGGAFGERSVLVAYKMAAPQPTPQPSGQ